MTSDWLDSEIHTYIMKKLLTCILKSVYIAYTNLAISENLFKTFSQGYSIRRVLFLHSFALLRVESDTEEMAQHQWCQHEHGVVEAIFGEKVAGGCGDYQPP